MDAIDASGKTNLQRLFYLHSYKIFNYEILSGNTMLPGCKPNGDEMSPTSNVKE